MELVQATEWICQAKWYRKEDGDVLRAALAQASQLRPGRWRPQNYANMCAFIPQTLWLQLTNPDMDFVGKLRALMAHLAALGLRHPSEPTFATVTALAIVCHEGSDKAKAVSLDHLSDTYTVAKATWKKLRLGPAMEFVESLPATAAAYQVAHPSLYVGTFLSGGPMASPVSALDVAAVASAVPMRKRDGRKTAAVAQQPQVLNMMQEMARFFMSSFQAGPQQNGIPGLQSLRPVPNGAQRPLTHGSSGPLQIRAPVQQQSEPFQMQADPLEQGPIVQAQPSQMQPDLTQQPSQMQVAPMDLMQQEPTVPAQPSQMQAAPPWTRTSPHAMAGSVWPR